jgi:hypothetical protein
MKPGHAPNVLRQTAFACWAGLPEPVFNVSVRGKALCHVGNVNFFSLNLNRIHRFNAVLFRKLSWGSFLPLLALGYMR